MSGEKDQRTPPWKRGRFNEPDTDPLSGFANIMDVMLVFALGLLVALIAQGQEVRRHFNLADAVDVSQGRELAEPPEALRKTMKGDTDSMESLGQVYRDPNTGKLILIGR